MSTYPLATAASDRLLQLIERIEALPDFAEVVDSLQAGHAATLDGVWGSSCALVAAALARAAPAVLVIVCPRLDEVQGLIGDLGIFSPLEPLFFPVRESLSTERTGAPGHPVPWVVLGRDEAVGDRVRVLKTLVGPQPPKVVVTSIPALLQPVPSPQRLAEQTRTLRIGEALSVEDISRWLVSGGFQNTTAVELPGEFSHRGGIIDIFAPDWFNPVRIELFGDEIESIRRFEVASQRSLERVEAIDVTAAGGAGSGRDTCEAGRGAGSSHLADYLPPRSWFLLIEPGELESEGRQYLERLDRPQGFHDVAEVIRRAVMFPSITSSAIATGSLETTCRLPIESVERFSGHIEKVREELDDAGRGQEVFLICQTEAEVRRLGEVFAGTQLAHDGRLHFSIGALRNGFRLVPDRIVLLSSGELFRRPWVHGARDLQRPTSGAPGTPGRRRLGKAIDSFLDLHEGDLVVHLSHGIARYRGMKLMEKQQGHVEEHLELEFAGKTKLYVPASKIGLVQKYVGGGAPGTPGRGRPLLARLGGRLWEKQKQRVESAVTDMAAEMLELQALRASRPGISFRVDTEWQHEFDASFPYKETPDQLTTLEAIRHDMQAPRPMDRLLCGDVGYGKTEVAMRAAFKAIDSGYQVAVLVPTTILAEQHLRTFTARMAEFPFSIASLSRFSTHRQQAEIIQRLAAGSVDVIIGTHRLVQPDVKFHNLGLIVIDEEQRFGVQVKERLKAMRQTVDVLTMTATPIPRTLHMGLIGVRDISNLETPPDDRLAVETRVTRFNPELVRQAVLRELNRQGQIYFVHNRVQDIRTLAAKLGRIVPEARIRIAHGQMAEQELERVMLDFVAHRFDILLATTIIESGLDIPNANTIFIDEADHYGLADLHQLRGRVGRYIHRAYCYLLLDPDKNLTSTSARRLKAIEEFSQMGAGFAIAMRDLEIRGAGNILGTEQSGHIAVVGYELYCSLLKQAVQNLKREPVKQAIEIDVDLPGEGHIPRSYVPDMRLKIDLYRRLSRISAMDELGDLRGELRDRFGPPPPLVEHLLWLAELRILAHRWQIEAIHLEPPYVVFRYRSARLIRELADQSGGKLRVVDNQSAYLPFGHHVLVVGDKESPESIGRQVKSLLQLRRQDAYNSPP
jgi:transcription-repair coupling factor (superfamily II helicase)